MVEIATAADYPAIADLNLRSYFEYSSKLAAGSWDVMRLNLVNIAERAQKSQFFIVRNQRGLVASVAYCPAKFSDPTIFKPNEASVLLLAVAPESRGKGFSKSLLNTCIECALHDGAASIGLFTSEYMQSAQHLYRLAGFKQEAELPMRYGARYFRFTLSLTSVPDQSFNENRHGHE